MQIQQQERIRKLNFIDKADAIDHQIHAEDSILLKNSSENRLLVHQMKEMSEELDRLINDEATKNRQIANKEVLVKTRPCGHKTVI